jgi:hypothetical protein
MTWTLKSETSSGLHDRIASDIRSILASNRRILDPMVNRRLLLTLAMVVSLIGCFEDPVREHVHLSFIGGNAVVVSTVLDVAEPDVAGSNPELAGRLDEARSEIEGGWDRWLPLYGQLEPVAERYSIEKVDGLARRALYSAVVPRFEPVERFLGSEGISATLAGQGPLRELQLYPTGGTRATWRQQEEVDRRIDEWSEAVADYLAAGIALYDYLERHPNRAVSCFSHVFDQHGPESGPLSDHEAELVEQIDHTTLAVAKILTVESGEAHSINELSRLVFDPFPTRLTLSVDGPVLSSDGFVTADGIVERPAVDLWRAMTNLEGRWLLPDLVTAMVSPAPEDQQPETDAAEFARKTRRFGAPPAGFEVADSLRSDLVPPTSHVVRWRSSSSGQPKFEEIDPRKFIAAAEAALPR